MSQVQERPVNRLDDPEPLKVETKVGQLMELHEGQVVAFTLPRTWPTAAKGQVRPAMVVFCFRSSSGRPTGTCNLVVFLNGPADTGDMPGPKTRSVAFEAGVKRAEVKEGEPGRWHDFSWTGEGEE